MKKKFVIALVVIVLVAGVVWFALSLRGTPGGANIVRIGSILGLTGDNAVYGEKMKKGFDLAAAEINEKGGINGKKIQLVIEDSQFQPAKAVTAFQKLTGTDSVRFIVGITGSKNALAVCAVSKDMDIVILDALSSAPKLTTHGGPNYFRIMPSDAFAGKYNVDWALEEGMKHPAIVYMEDDWGTSYRDAILNSLQAKGVKAVATEGVKEGERNLRTQVEKIRVAKPDTVFIVLYAKEGSAFAQQAREAGIKAKFYGSDNISSNEFVAAGAEVVEGVRVAMPAAVKGPLYDDFVKKYRAKYNEDPDANVIKSYDALILMAHALTKAGESPSGIKNFLRSGLDDYNGVSGKIRFDQNGDIVDKTYRRLFYKSGKLESIS